MTEETARVLQKFLVMIEDEGKSIIMCVIDKSSGEVNVICSASNNPRTVGLMAQEMLANIATASEEMTQNVSSTPIQ